ncbi:MAG: hypothetical protein JXA99_13340 [Candidatus Lokiarchaeota archaeon]|nr:hypothetical protein [Candidatus Lokiarchaeota archaeon]
MNDMTVTFKKIKNINDEYMVIFNSIEFVDNIIMYFELSLKNIKKFMEFINMLQNYYKISYYDIVIDSEDDIEITHEFDCILKSCPF